VRERVIRRSFVCRSGAEQQLLAEERGAELQTDG
jgi:hypothetical protein